jgi:hypothetical protein
VKTGLQAKRESNPVEMGSKYDGVLQCLSSHIVLRFSMHGSLLPPAVQYTTMVWCFNQDNMLPLQTIIYIYMCIVFTSYHLLES